MLKQKSLFYYIRLGPAGPAGRRYMQTEAIHKQVSLIIKRLGKEYHTHDIAFLGSIAKICHSNINGYLLHRILEVATKKTYKNNLILHALGNRYDFNYTTRIHFTNESPLLLSEIVKVRNLLNYIHNQDTKLEFILTVNPKNYLINKIMTQPQKTEIQSKLYFKKFDMLGPTPFCEYNSQMLDEKSILQGIYTYHVSLIAPNFLEFNLNSIQKEILFNIKQITNLCKIKQEFNQKIIKIQNLQEKTYFLNKKEPVLDYRPTFFTFYAKNDPIDYTQIKPMQSPINQMTDAELMHHLTNCIRQQDPEIRENLVTNIVYFPKFYDCI